VDPEHPDARPGADSCRGKGALESLFWRDVKTLADEVLAGQRAQDRPAGGHELTDPMRDLERMPRVLSEVVTWVDKHSGARDPRRDGALSERHRPLQHILHDVVVLHPVRPCPRTLAARMCAHETGTMRRGDVGESRIDAAPRVIDHVRSGPANDVRDLGAACVDRDDQPGVLRTNGFDEIKDAVDLLARGDGLTRRRFDAPDVDDVSAFGHYLLDPVQGGSEGIGATSIEERVGSPVHDGHDQSRSDRHRLSAEVEHPGSLPDLQAEGVRLACARRELGEGNRMRPEVEQWLHRRTYSPPFPEAHDLATAKGSRTISLLFPALNEARTVGQCVATAQAELVAPGLVDELLVVDGGSEDETVAIAAEAGARVISTEALLPEWPDGGKGAAVWRGAHAAMGDVLVLVDADLEPFRPEWVCALVAPLLLEPSIALVKAAADRPLTVEGVVHPRSGGRVTELVARPLLALFWPELAGFMQPLAGELCLRRSLFERLTVTTGYGLEMGMLLEAHALCGLDALAQVDIGERHHRHHPDLALGAMAAAVLQAAATHLEHEGRLMPGVLGRELLQFARDAHHRLDPHTVDVGVARLPPLLSLDAYRAGRADS
jgi:glucosyl-3-phosphoglycerate synthase